MQSWGTLPEVCSKTSSEQSTMHCWRQWPLIGGFFPEQELACQDERLSSNVGRASRRGAVGRSCAVEAQDPQDAAQQLLLRCIAGS